MPRPRAITLSATALAEAEIGAYVELSGVLRSPDPVEGPFSRHTLVGFEVLCTLLTPDGVQRLDARRWGEAILEDDTGEAVIGLEGSRLKIPALSEGSFDEEDKIARVLEELGLTAKGSLEDAELLVLERGVRDGARVSLTGRVAEPTARESAYRASARPRRRVVGVRGAPLVIVPG